MVRLFLELSPLSECLSRDGGQLGMLGRQSRCAILQAVPGAWIIGTTFDTAKFKCGSPSR